MEPATYLPLSDRLDTAISAILRFVEHRVSEGISTFRRCCRVDG